MTRFWDEVWAPLVRSLLVKLRTATRSRLKVISDRPEFFEPYGVHVCSSEKGPVGSNRCDNFEQCSYRADGVLFDLTFSLSVEQIQTIIVKTGCSHVEGVFFDPIGCTDPRIDSFFFSDNHVFADQRDQVVKIYCAEELLVVSDLRNINALRTVERINVGRIFSCNRKPLSPWITGFSMFEGASVVKSEPILIFKVPNVLWGQDSGFEFITLNRDILNHLCKFAPRQSFGEVFVLERFFEKVHLELLTFLYKNLPEFAFSEFSEDAEKSCFTAYLYSFVILKHCMDRGFRFDRVFQQLLDISPDADKKFATNCMEFLLSSGNTRKVHINASVEYMQMPQIIVEAPETQDPSEIEDSLFLKQQIEVFGRPSDELPDKGVIPSPEFLSEKSKSDKTVNKKTKELPEQDITGMIPEVAFEVSPPLSFAMVPVARGRHRVKLKRDTVASIT